MLQPESLLCHLDVFLFVQSTVVNTILSRFRVSVQRCSLDRNKFRHTVALLRERERGKQIWRFFASLPSVTLTSQRCEVFYGVWTHLKSAMLDAVLCEVSPTSSHCKPLPLPLPNGKGRFSVVFGHLITCHFIQSSFQAWLSTCPHVGVSVSLCLWSSDCLCHSLFFCFSHSLVLSLPSFPSFSLFLLCSFLPLSLFLSCSPTHSAHPKAWPKLLPFFFLFLSAVAVSFSRGLVWFGLAWSGMRQTVPTEKYVTHVSLFLPWQAVLPTKQNKCMKSHRRNSGPWGKLHTSPLARSSWMEI